MAVVAILAVNQLDAFWSYLAVALVIQAIAALSVGIVHGRSGMVSLCQLSFAAVGAWTMAWFASNRPETPFIVQIAVSALVAVPFGALVGLPTLRLRGDVIAVVTLAAAVATSSVLSGLGFPGEDEFVAVTRPTWLIDDRVYFAFATVCLVLVGIVLIKADNGRAGSRWLALGRSERALASYGHSVAAAKIGAFAAAAFVASLSGALLAAQVGNISATSFSPVGSLVLFALAVMCGARTVDGAVIAGLLSVGLPELLRRLGVPQDVGSILFGLGAVQALVHGGGGISSEIRRGVRQVRGRVTPVRSTSSSKVVPSAPSGIRPAAAGQTFTVNGLSVSYGAVAALTDVTISIPPRTVVALIGPNGAGKSTFVDTVTGFVHQTSGNVMLGEERLDGWSPAQRSAAGIRRTFQSGRAMLDSTIDQYLRLASGTARTTWTERRRVADFMGLPDSSTPVASLDTGVRKVVEVAGTLMARPHLVILDEPAAGLSESETEVLGRQIAAIPEVFGASVLLIDHDMTFVQQTASVTHVLDFGRHIASGSPAEVLRDSAVAKAYLGEVAL